MFFVYIVKCRDGTLYTGWSNDVAKRVDCHNKGKGSKYTRTRLPVHLVFFEERASKSDAMKREWEIKCLNRNQKDWLIRTFVR